MQTMCKTLDEHICQILSFYIQIKISVLDRKYFQNRFWHNVIVISNEVIREIGGFRIISIIRYPADWFVSFKIFSWCDGWTKVRKKSISCGFPLHIVCKVFIDWKLAFFFYFLNRVCNANVTKIQDTKIPFVHEV